MTDEDKTTIRTMQRNLMQIKRTGKAPINLVQYQKMGLIAIRRKNVKLASGRTEKIFDRLLLTDKGKRTLSAIV